MFVVIYLGAPYHVIGTHMNSLQDCCWLLLLLDVDFLFGLKFFNNLQVKGLFIPRDNMFSFGEYPLGSFTLSKNSKIDLRNARKCRELLLSEGPVIQDFCTFFFQDQACCYFILGWIFICWEWWSAINLWKHLALQSWKNHTVTQVSSPDPGKFQVWGTGCRLTWAVPWSTASVLSPSSYNCICHQQNLFLQDTHPFWFLSKQYFQPSDARH